MRLINDQEIYSIDEICTLLSINRVTLQTIINRKEISYILIGKRKFISAGELQSYINK